MTTNRDLAIGPRRLTVQQTQPDGFREHYMRNETYTDNVTW